MHMFEKILSITMPIFISTHPSTTYLLIYIVDIKAIYYIAFNRKILKNAAEAAFGKGNDQ